MILCVDTAYKKLGMCLIKDKNVIDSIDEECFKNQSEFLFVKLDVLLSRNNVSLSDIDGICISIGPGSYTGVRLALTMAKVLCSLEKNIKLYTISTLKLYSNGLDDVLVLMDARANRAYYAYYKNGVSQEGVLPISEINITAEHVVGDFSLLGKEDYYYPIGECFLNSISSFELCMEVDYLVPNYLKDTSTYKS